MWHIELTTRQAYFKGDSLEIQIDCYFFLHWKHKQMPRLLTTHQEFGSMCVSQVKCSIDIAFFAHILPFVCSSICSLIEICMSFLLLLNPMDGWDSSWKMASYLLWLRLEMPNTDLYSTQQHEQIFVVNK